MGFFAKLFMFIIFIIILFVAVIAGAVYYISYLQNAHSSFDNYYNFRGCTSLVSKTDNYGYCKLQDNQTIEIVRCQNNKWYLNGDTGSQSKCGSLLG